MLSNRDFLSTAKYVELVYGSELIYNEETGELYGFECPECHEIIWNYEYKEPKTQENEVCCPFCYFNFYYD